MVDGGAHVPLFSAGYVQFINKGNVVQLAVAFVIGGAFQQIVSSLVADIFMPPIGLLFGNNMQNLFFVIKAGGTHNASYNTLAQAQADGAVTENVGKFLQTIVNFLIVSFLLYLLILFYTTYLQKYEAMLAAKLEEEKAAQPPAPVTDRPCPYCKKPVDKTAVRCCWCTSPIEAVKE